MSPKSFESREAFNEAFLAKVDEYELDLIVLAGFLVTIPAAMIAKYRNRIINVHPSLIPSFCGVGYYGLKVHQAALARGVKITGAPCILWTREWTRAPLFYRKPWRCCRGTRRRYCSGG